MATVFRAYNLKNQTIDAHGMSTILQFSSDNYVGAIDFGDNSTPVSISGKTIALNGDCFLLLVGI